jgi:SAM-dependent methyltransferase
MYIPLLEEAMASGRTLLELSSGGGNNALYMKRRFQMTLVDLSPRMLEVSRRLNPDLDHVQGDMRSVRLGRTFDVVFIHDAIMYMTTEDDLRRALETAAAHARAGGALLVTPDHTRETFAPNAGHGGHDAPDRSMRYLSWAYDPDPSDSWYNVSFAFLLREEDGPAIPRFETHRFGLFPRDVWLALLREVGFEARIVAAEDGRDLFLGRRV